MSEVPIIILSAYKDFGFKQRAMNEGATDFLTKPDDIHRLKDVINEYLTDV